MNLRTFTIMGAALALTAPGISQAESRHVHNSGQHGASAMQAATEASAPVEPGQGAFAAIAEIVALLQADPETDWSRVNVPGLGRHLIDMDNVTLRADVETEFIDGGAKFSVTSKDPIVAASIGRMVLAHAATMNGANGLKLLAEQTPAGARLTATGERADMIRGLGFIGLMTVGMHHPAHHLAIARGRGPHSH